jgi:Ni/Fe-hydrogenase subunit HybB-like protein
MRYVHLIFGILLFVVFTITGRYMRADFPEKDAIPPEFRILMRSRHIYILFSALIHIGLGLYMQLRPLIVQKILQISGSAVLVYSSVMLVWAFAVETYQLQHFSNLSRSGIYASLAGIGLHLIGGLGKRSSG